LKVVFTDYTEEVNQLLSENIKLQGVSKSYEIQLVDWTKPEDYDKVASTPVDIVIATDVIYKGSPYSDMANLLLLVCQRNTRAEIMIIIPK
jgi:predicted nicotinamide N-methyase